MPGSPWCMCEGARRSHSTTSRDCFAGRNPGHRVKSARRGWECGNHRPGAGRPTSRPRWPANSRSRVRRGSGREASHMSSGGDAGKVYIVSSAPGDPDLVTWKGRKLLAIADSVLYDHLATAHLLDLAPNNC